MRRCCGSGAGAEVTAPLPLGLGVLGCSTSGPRDKGDDKDTGVDGKLWLGTIGLLLFVSKLGVFHSV